MKDLYHFIDVYTTTRSGMLWYILGIVMGWGANAFFKEKPDLRPAYQRGYEDGVECGMKTAAHILSNYGEMVNQDLYNRPPGDVRIGPVSFSGKHAADVIHRHIEKKDFEVVDEFI